MFAPAALDRLGAGFDDLTAVVAVTLGPMQGPILNARSAGSVELLAGAGDIARRVVEVPGRGRNAGAMIARHLVWRMHEQFGDGAATAAVLSRAMVRAAAARIAAGIDPADIRVGLDRALPVALDGLSRSAMPAEGEGVLAAVATGITGDPELGAVLGEIVDLLGPDAALSVEEFLVPYLDREYLEGAVWRAHPAARGMIPEGRREVAVEQPLILLADQRLAELADIQPALELAVAARRPLLIVPAGLSDPALATVVANLTQGRLTAVAALLAASGAALTDELGDIAALTGGTVLGDVLGRPPGRVRAPDLGSARRAVLTPESLTIIGGAGDPAAVAERASLARRRMAHLSPTDDEWQRLQGRVARLSGGSAILKLGAHSGVELTHRRAQAEKAFRVLTGMLADGVVPGGGVAYLALVPELMELRESCPESRFVHGIDVLAAALEAPFQQLVRNRGLVHPPLALAEARRRGEGYGLDILNGEYVEMRERGILDGVRVTRGALRLAASTASALFSTGVVVLPPAERRKRSVQP